MADGTKVQLYVYDLSNGLAASLSPVLLGKQIDGIWHTSIVVNGSEFYFGGGISVAPAGTTVFGTPVQIIEIGDTHLPMEYIRDLVEDLRHRFTQSSYNLLSNNCNNFTNELAKLLTGNGIPDHIVKLPDEVMSTPFGQMIQPMLEGLETQLGAVHEAPVAPPKPPSNAPPPSDQALKSEVEAAIRAEFASLVAEGGVTPNQAAAMTLEKIVALYGDQAGGSGRNDKSQA